MGRVLLCIVFYFGDCGDYHGWMYSETTGPQHHSQKGSSAAFGTGVRAPRSALCVGYHHQRLAPPDSMADVPQR
jgi:hypothetical protein